MKEGDNIKRFIIKAISVCIVGITVYAVFQVICTIKNHDEIISPISLRMSIVLEAAFWLITILIRIIVYIIILKNFKNKGGVIIKKSQRKL